VSADKNSELDSPDSGIDLSFATAFNLRGHTDFFPRRFEL
jgi:hypothetical protein